MAHAVANFAGGSPQSARPHASASTGGALPTSPTALNTEEATIPFDDLTFGDVIGRGSFGRVCRGTFRGAVVAIKALAVRALQSADMLKYLHSELSVLRCAQGNGSTRRAAAAGDATATAVL